MDDAERPRLIPLGRALLKALSGGKVAFIHTRRDLRQRIAKGAFPFFNRFCGVLDDMGYDVALMALYRPPWVGWLNRKCLHVYRGPGRTWRGRGVLSVAKGYIGDYWYVDPLGHRENSSIGARNFRPKKVPDEGAISLYGALRRSFVHQGRSPREQIARGSVDLPDGCIAIMLQVVPRGQEPKGAVCSEAQMIRTVVASRGERPVVIKFHPFGASHDVRPAAAEVADGQAVQIVDANVHDILEAASVVCTQTSGVGFEAMLHRTPTILFAAADYHHCAIRVEHIEETAAALQDARTRRFLYGKYVYWFLEMNLFHPESGNFANRIRRVIETVSQSPRDRKTDQGQP